MLIPDSDRSWEAYGRMDPYFGVVTREEFRQDRMDDERRAQFFATGERHIAAIFEDIQAFAPGFTPRRALDFGCGVGRLLAPLARRCEQVTGVDISAAMRAEAEANMRRLGIDNVTLAPSDDSLSAVKGSFDLVHSFIVFQHMPVKRGEAVLRALLDRLEPDGVGALHFTFAPGRSARHAWHWMRHNVPLVNGLTNVKRGRPFSYPVMQVNSYDLNRIMATLQDGGCHLAQLRATRHAGVRGAVIYFRKREMEAL